MCICKVCVSVFLCVCMCYVCVFMCLCVCVSMCLCLCLKDLFPISSKLICDPYCPDYFAIFFQTRIRSQDRLLELSCMQHKLVRFPGYHFFTTAISMEKTGLGPKLI